jgi:uncharacterized membrane protein YphA (DoxX/SURF4 family)
MIFNKLSALRISIGFIYLWFGALKFFPGLSPAEGLAIDTIDIITLGIIPGSVSIILLAIIEVTLGALLVFNVTLKQVVIATLIHLVCTFVPLFAFIDLAFTQPPYGYTLLGQYIFKNIALMAGLWVIYPAKS